MADMKASLLWVANIFKEYFHFQTFKLPKRVAKNTKNMT